MGPVMEEEVTVVSPQSPPPHAEMQAGKASAREARTGLGRTSILLDVDFTRAVASAIRTLRYLHSAETRTSLKTAPCEVHWGWESTLTTVHFFAPQSVRTGL